MMNLVFSFVLGALLGAYVMNLYLVSTFRNAFMKSLEDARIPGWTEEGTYGIQKGEIGPLKEARRKEEESQESGDDGSQVIQ